MEESTIPESNSFVTQLKEIYALAFPGEGEPCFTQVFQETQDVLADDNSLQLNQKRSRCDINLLGTHLGTDEFFNDWELAIEATAKHAVELLKLFLSVLTLKLTDPNFSRIFESIREHAGKAGCDIEKLMTAIPIVENTIKPVEAPVFENCFKSTKNPVTTLFELYSSQKIVTTPPKFETLKGDSNFLFGVTLTYGEHVVITPTNFSTIVEAKNEAAKILCSKFLRCSEIYLGSDTGTTSNPIEESKKISSLSIEDVTNNTPTDSHEQIEKATIQIPPTSDSVKPVKNAIALLYEYHARSNSSDSNGPEFEINRIGTAFFGAILRYKGETITTKICYTKIADAKLAAAQLFCKSLDINENNIHLKRVKASLNTDRMSESPSVKKYVSTLLEYCQSESIPPPEYIFEESIVPSFRCKSENFLGQSFGGLSYPKKSVAKENCARDVVSYLMEEGLIKGTEKFIRVDFKMITENLFDPMEEEHEHESEDNIEIYLAASNVENNPTQDPMHRIDIPMCQNTKDHIDTNRAIQDDFRDTSSRTIDSESIPVFSPDLMPSADFSLGDTKELFSTFMSSISSYNVMSGFGSFRNSLLKVAISKQSDR